MMRQTLSSAAPDNEAAQNGAFDQRLSGRHAQTGEPSVSDAFKAIERIESRLTEIAPGVASTTPAGIDATLRGFESRISNLTERLSTGVRPIGKRGVNHEEDLKAAVAQIRHRQADLDHGIASPMQAPVRTAAPVIDRSHIDRSHGDVLQALRGDMARLSNQIESARGPERAAIEHLNREFASLRGSLGTLASRADVGQIEQSVAALSSQVAQARISGSGLAEASAQFKTLQASIQRLTEAQASRDDGRVVREIERLSSKLDGMAAGQPGLRDMLATQLDDIRAIVANAAAPAQISSLSHHVSSLRDEVAALTARQVDSQEVAALRASLDDMYRLMSVNPGARPTGAGADLASGLKPVEVLLHALVDRLDSVERQVGSRGAPDTGALDSLERQIANLATKLSENAGRDPSVAHLEKAMSQLVGEISSWRAGAPPANGGSVGREIADLRQRCEATEKQTQDSLAAVNRTLQDVAARIAGLGGEHAQTSAQPLSPSAELVPAAAEPMQPSLAEGAALKRMTDAIAADTSRREPARGESLPPALTAEDEILLEPGAARPPVAAGSKPAPELAVDAADIKSSFIAAARRAAQAAATDAAAAAARSRVPATREAAGAEAGSPDLMGRFKSMVDRRRRPLLLSAAAVVLAIGSFQIMRESMESVTPPSSTAQLPSLSPIELAEANGQARDPVTTGSVPTSDSAQASSPKLDQQVAPAPSAASAKTAPSVQAALPSQAAPSTQATPSTQAAPSSQVAATTQPPVKPAAPTAPDQPAASPETGITAAALKQAAQAGNPVAAYEFGVRTAEGRGVPRDPQIAARFFEKAAEKGLAPAQYRTGNLYEKGIGVPRDVEAAKTWYRRAAENGNTRAMHNLAVLLAEGAGGKPDYQSAIGWFERAAAQGMRDSQFNLAVLLARGLGTAQNLPQSYTWFAVAATGGDQDAAKKRDEVGARLSSADLARAKLGAETWHVTQPNAAANEVTLPANGFAESTPPTPATTKKAPRESRV
jgi:localization factor PodJL